MITFPHAKTKKLRNRLYQLNHVDLSAENIIKILIKEFPLFKYWLLRIEFIRDGKNFHEHMYPQSQKYTNLECIKIFNAIELIYRYKGYINLYPNEKWKVNVYSDSLAALDTPIGSNISRDIRFWSKLGS